MTSVQERTYSVVLADDTYDIRVLTRIVLERSGWFDIVGEAEDGQRAIDQVAALRPDVLLLDLAMPVMDGLAAIPHVRKAAPETQIIVLSGFEKSAMAEEALRLGAVGYIQKGIHKDALVAEILAVCGADADAGSDGSTRSMGSADAPPQAPEATSPDKTARPPRAATAPVPVADRGTATALAAHELRSPLTTIIGSAQTLERRWPELDDPTREALLAAIVRQGRRMERLVDDLLTMSRLDAGAFPIVAGDHDARSLVVQAVEGLGPLDPPVHVEIDGEPVVRGDDGRIVQMLDNLLVNATRYGRPPVSLRVTEADGMVTFSVRDRGDGVAPDLVGNLFTRWTPAATGQGGSVGLGLSIVRELAEAQGGRVGYRTGAAGGAEFSLVLPAAG